MRDAISLQEACSMPTVRIRRLACLLCDANGPLRRLRPERIYACERCVRKHGADTILEQLPHHIVAFNRRHAPKGPG